MIYEIVNTYGKDYWFKSDKQLKNVTVYGIYGKITFTVKKINGLYILDNIKYDIPYLMLSDKNAKRLFNLEWLQTVTTIDFECGYFSSPSEVIL